MLFKNTASKLNINTDTIYWIGDTVRYVEEKIRLGEEDYNNSKHPFGYCKICESEFNSELINEYEIKNCPWCGNPIIRQTNSVIG